MAKSNNLKNKLKNVDPENDVGGQINTSPTINLGSKLKEIKKCQ